MTLEELKQQVIDRLGDAVEQSDPKGLVSTEFIRALIDLLSTIHHITDKE